MRGQLSKDQLVTLRMLLTERENRKLEAAIRKARRARIRSTIEAAALLALFVAMLVWSREGGWMRECPIWAQALTWYAWLYAAFAWSALRVLPIFRGDAQ